MSTQISGQITQVYTKIKDNIGKVIVGKSETLDMLLVSLLCGGHVLLEDVPGTGKTVLIKSLAASVSCQYNAVRRARALAGVFLQAHPVYPGSLAVRHHRRQFLQRQEV